MNKAWLAYDELSLRFEGRTCGVGENYFAYLNEIALRYAHIPQMLTGATEVLSGTRDAFSLEFPIDVDGHIRWYLMRALPIEGGASGIVVAHEDITDRMLAHIALQEANNRLRLLSQRVLTVQEEERRYISRELHDDLGQTLTALKINLHLLGALPPADVPMKLADCTLVAEGALEKLRQMSSDLHPPQLDQLGLEDALRYLADRQAIQTGVQVNCENGDLKERLPKAVELALFRIAQEAISNAARHAKASQISLRIERQGDLVMLRINDDGEGFDPATARQSALKKGSLGLISMEERAQLAGGRLQLRSVKGLGTVITATIPLATIPGDASATVNKGGG